MGREKPDYRDILERLDEQFPEREMLTKAEVASWLGVSPRTVSRRYGWPRGLVSKTRVARAVSTS